MEFRRASPEFVSVLPVALPVKKWHELTYKDKLSYSLAIVCFAIGWIITFIAFFIPPIGTVADSILFILGQSLLFTGAVIGIGQYYNAQTQNFKYEIRKFIGEQPEIKESSFV